VQQWVALSDANRRHFDHLRLISETGRAATMESTVSEEAAWKNFKKRLSGSAGGKDAVGDGETVDRQLSGGRLGDESLGDQNAVNRKMGPRSLRGLAWLRVAAALIALFTGGWLYYTYSYTPGQYLFAHSDMRVLTDTLPEGTVVVLNRQSSIRYRRQFTADTRPVEMEGEAFFRVAADKNRPFIVHAKGMTINVLGTSFNVKTTAAGMEVIVETGMVEVTKNGQTMTVRPHEKVVTAGKDAPLVKENNMDALYNYYRTNEFECNGTPLWRVVEKLNEVYQAHIVIGDERLRNLPLTTTFHDESLDAILVVISRSFSIKPVKKGSEIILQ
jgi:ferric-dicitrate binding protein FerR (iron transport regulator)